MWRERPNLRLSRGVGLAVREQRGRLHLSQNQLALQTGLSRGYVSALELGRKDPDLDVVAALAEALDCDLVMLVKRAQDLVESEERAASGEERIAPGTDSDGEDARNSAD